MVSGCGTESFATLASCARVVKVVDAEFEAAEVADRAGSPQAESNTSAHPTIDPTPARAFKDRTAPVRRSAITPKDSRHLVLRVQHGVHFLADRDRLLRDLRDTVV